MAISKQQNGEWWAGFYVIAPMKESENLINNILLKVVGLIGVSFLTHTCDPAGEPFEGLPLAPINPNNPVLINAGVMAFPTLADAKAWAAKQGFKFFDKPA